MYQKDICLLFCHQKIILFAEVIVLHWKTYAIGDMIINQSQQLKIMKQKTGHRKQSWYYLRKTFLLIMPQIKISEFEQVTILLILPNHEILIFIWRILSYRAPLFQTVSPPQNEELGLHAIPWLGGRFKNPKRYIHHICMMWCCCCRVDVLQSFHQVQFRV